MMRFRITRALAVALAAAPIAAAIAGGPPSSPSAPIQAPAKRAPNVIFVLIDDMGWQDVGFMGSRYYRTPNIDRLAGRSVVFTDAYANAPNCAPTRAALMSGQWAPRTGIYTVSSSERGPAAARKLVPTPNTDVLAPRFVTLAESFKANGYATGSFGKWHLGEPGEAGPREQGFDVNVGGDTRGGPSRGGYTAPYGRPGGKAPPGLETAPEGEYLTDRLTDEAIAFMTTNKDRPFFLYLPHYGVHTPLDAKPNTTGPWDAVPIGQRQGVPAYASMVQSVDESIGRLVSELGKLGLSDDTIIVFTSDNGGFVGSTYAPGLRGSKGMLYEGGIRVPTFVHVPGGVQGTRVATPIQTFDFYPTLVELAGLKLPAGVALDGRSVASAARTGKPLPSKPLYWHLPVYLEGDRGFPGSPQPPMGLWRSRPSAAIRDGDWKLIEQYEDGSVELYNLARDPKEATNLAKSQPGTAKRLLDALHGWQRATGAPIPTKANPAYDPNFVAPDRRGGGGGRRRGHRRGAMTQ